MQLLHIQTRTTLADIARGQAQHQRAVARRAWLIERDDARLMTGRVECGRALRQ